MGKCSAGPGRLELAEVIPFESSSSGLVHRPDSFACVHCRPPELGLHEGAPSLRLRHRCFLHRCVRRRQVVQASCRWRDRLAHQLLLFLHQLNTLQGFRRFTGLCKALGVQASDSCGERQVQPVLLILVSVHLSSHRSIHAVHPNQNSQRPRASSVEASFRLSAATRSAIPLSIKYRFGPEVFFVIVSSISCTVGDLLNSAARQRERERERKTCTVLVFRQNVDPNASWSTQFDDCGLPVSQIQERLSTFRTTRDIGNTMVLLTFRRNYGCTCNEFRRKSGHISVVCNTGAKEQSLPATSSVLLQA